MISSTELDFSLQQRSASADPLFRRLLAVAAGAAGLLLVVMTGYLIAYSAPLWAIQSPISFLTSPNWITGIQQPNGSTLEIYGAASVIFGTAVTSLIAVLFAAPIGIFGAVYLVEFAPRRLAVPLAFLVELIAAIPSVVFGLWAVGDLSTRLRDSIEWWIASSIGQIVPWLSEDPTSPASDSVFRAGFLLGIMILPMIVAVSREFLRSVPISLREGYIGMGATRWESIRDVVLPTARIGLIGAVLLALGRALGETIAVTMVIGNAEGIPASLFLPGQTLASKIANNIGEVSGPVQRASLVGLALALFLLTLMISLVVRLSLRRFSRIKAVS
jgi:phosphate transport system permease protein